MPMMLRRTLMLCVLLASPSLSWAGEPTPPRALPDTTSTSRYNTPGVVVSGESCPPGGCGTSQTAPARKGFSPFGNAKGSCSSCNNGYDCDAPLHCSTFHREATFIFGGCRSFFSNKCVPAAGYYGPQTGPCEYGTFHSH